jgi:hypothetical protein
MRGETKAIQVPSRFPSLDKGRVRVGSDQGIAFFVSFS